MPDEEIYPELIPMVNMCEDEYEQRYGAVMFGFIMGGQQISQKKCCCCTGQFRQ